MTTPITPLTVISNGSETLLIDTYSGEEIPGKTLDDDQIGDIIRNALTLSKNALKESITTLIENDHRIIFDVINAVSAEEFKKLTGEIDDFRKPIVRDFLIERQVLTDLADGLNKHSGLFLTGDPYIGKTTVLYQLYLKEKADGNALFFINCTDQNYSVFKKLAAFITKHMQYLVDENKVKEWLLLGLNNRKDEDRLVIVFDHLRYDAESSLKSEIVEIFDLFKSENNRLILAADNSNYDLLIATEGRQTENFYTLNFEKIKIRAFSREEYKYANDELLEKFGAGVLSGGIYAGEYRTPRIWRLLAMASAKLRTQPDTLAFVEAVPSFNFLTLVTSNLHFDPQTIQDFRELTQAYIEALPIADSNGYIKLMALNVPVIAEGELKKHIHKDVIKRMERTGFIEKRLIPDHLWVYIPKIPELIAGFAVDYVKEKFLPELEADFEKGYKSFMVCCEYLPYGEIIAARTIAQWSYENHAQIFGQFINTLQDDGPTVETSDGGKLVRMYLPDHGHVDVPIEAGEEQRFAVNIFPFLVLSHLVSFQFVDDSKHPDMERAKCIIAVGQINFPVRPIHPNVIFETIPGMEVGNIGYLIQSNIGIVEPIVQSIQANIKMSPMVMKALLLHSITEKSYHLLHRIYIAARFTLDDGDAETKRICNFVESKYMEHFNKMMAFALAPPGANRTARREIEKRLDRRDAKK